MATNPNAGRNPELLRAFGADTSLTAFEHYKLAAERLTPEQRVVEALTVRPLAQAFFGPQFPLTERLFGPDETAGSRAANIAMGIAPFAAGFGVGGMLARPMAALGARVGAPILGDILAGAGGGAAGAVPAAVAEEQPIGPAAAGGALLGGGLGGAFWGFSRAGNRLAAAYAARPGKGSLPSMSELDNILPNVSLEASEAASRAEAARSAFRRMIPEGTPPDIKSTNPVLYARALADARAAARSAKVPTSALAELELEGLTLQNLRERVFRITNDPLRKNSQSALEAMWGRYVTRLGTTLLRDPEFGPQGREMANIINRSNQLADHFEGQMRTRVFDPLWRNVPKHEEEIIDRVLHGQGGKLSAQGVAVVKRWQEIADDAFEQMKAGGVMEEVSPNHPAVTGGQQDLFPDLPRAQTPDTWKIVPIQKRTNYVPYYRDPAGVAKLLQKGSAERKAYMQDLVERGEAENMKQAGQLLDDLLERDAHFSPLHIRNGPFQHERELALNLPREKNAKRWMDHWIHDFSRRMATATIAGGQDQKVKALLQQMEEGGNFAGAERMRRLWQNFVGRPPRDVARMLPLARKARAGLAVNLLGPRVGLLQILQSSNTVSRMGVMRTLEGIAAGVRHPELRAAAQEVGALLPSQHLLSAEEPISQVGRWWIDNVTQMPRGDRLSRGLAALTGGTSAQNWAREYYKLAAADAAAGTPSLSRTGLLKGLKYVGIRNRGERMAILERRLERDLGIPVQHILETKGELPWESIQVAMRNASHNTQFANSILDMPEARRTGWGQFLYMLKTFSKQQSTFVSRLSSDAMRGDTGPLVRYLLAYPALYVAVKPFLDFLGARDAVDEADQETMERVRSVLEGAAWTGVFGSMGDFVNQMMATDPGKSLYNYLVGPAIAQTVGTVGDVGTLVREGDVEPLATRLTPRALRPLIKKIQGD